MHHTRHTDSNVSWTINFFYILKLHLMNTPVSFSEEKREHTTARTHELPRERTNMVYMYVL
jgi:hypothetical protein